MASVFWVPACSSRSPGQHCHLGQPSREFSVFSSRLAAAGIARSCFSARMNSASLSLSAERWVRQLWHPRCVLGCTCTSSYGSPCSCWPPVELLVVSRQQLPSSCVSSSAASERSLSSCVSSAMRSFGPAIQPSSSCVASLSSCVSSFAAPSVDPAISQSINLPACSSRSTIGSAVFWPGHFSSRGIFFCFTLLPGVVDFSRALWQRRLLTRQFLSQSSPFSTSCS